MPASKDPISRRHGEVGEHPAAVNPARFGKKRPGGWRKNSQRFGPADEGRRRQMGDFCDTLKELRGALLLAAVGHGSRIRRCAAPPRDAAAPPCHQIVRESGCRAQLKAGEVAGTPRRVERQPAGTIDTRDPACTFSGRRGSGRQARKAFSATPAAGRRAPSARQAACPPSTRSPARSPGHGGTQWARRFGVPDRPPRNRSNRGSPSSSA